MLTIWLKQVMQFVLAIVALSWFILFLVLTICLCVSMMTLNNPKGLRTPCESIRSRKFQDFFIYIFSRPREVYVHRWGSNPNRCLCRISIIVSTIVLKSPLFGSIGELGICILTWSFVLFFNWNLQNLQSGWRFFLKYQIIKNHQMEIKMIREN